jgi:hypothetical protein
LSSVGGELSEVESDVLVVSDEVVVVEPEELLDEELLDELLELLEVEEELLLELVVVVVDVPSVVRPVFGAASLLVELFSGKKL